MSTLTASPTRPRIVCIDDDPDLLTALITRFKPYDVDVLPAYSGTHGIWLAVTEKPQLIVTDLRMPNGGGNYVVECLKTRDDTRDIPVIVLTGVNDHSARRWMQMLDVAAYLHKPLAFDVLMTEVRRRIDIKPLETVGSSMTTPAVSPGAAPHQPNSQRVGEFSRPARNGQT